MRAKIKSMVPEMSGNVQKTYNGSHGLMYCFIATLEDGTTGQVSSKSPAPHRFGTGDEVEYTYTPAQNPNHMGRLKVDRPKEDGASASSNGSASAPRGWSPEKEESVKIQGLLKSVIESGMSSANWEKATTDALAIHDRLLDFRLASQTTQPAY